MNSPKKSSKEDPFCDFTDGTYTFAVFVVVENNSTPVFTEEYNSELTSFASMSSPGTYSGTTWQSSSKKYCSSSEDAILLSLLLFSVLLFCAVFLRCGCVQKEKEEASSVSQRSRREKEKERENREKRREKNSQKKKNKELLASCSSLFFLCRPTVGGRVISSHENKNTCLWEPLEPPGRRNASTEEEVIALTLYAMDLRSSRRTTREIKSRASHLVRSDGNRNVLRNFRFLLTHAFGERHLCIGEGEALVVPSKVIRAVDF